jgi:AbrB family looped-hinge helix DNA binding protein
MESSTVTSKGQVTIPKEIRRALGIRQGSRVAFAQEGGKVELRVVHQAPQAVVSGFGMLDARGKRLPADFDAASLLAPRARRAKGAR